MLRTHIAFCSLIPAFALGLLSCTGDATTVDEETILEDEAAAVAPNPDLYGTFRSTMTRPGSMPLLVLMSDGTYHRGLSIACFTAPCKAVTEDGRYWISYREGTSYLTLYAGDGEMDRYQFVLAGETLRIRRQSESIWVSMEKTVDASWCGEPVDCTLQNLPVGPCAGAWYCGSNICNYSCRPPEETE